MIILIPFIFYFILLLKYILRYLPGAYRKRHFGKIPLAPGVAQGDNRPTYIADRGNNFGESGIGSRDCGCTYRRLTVNRLLVTVKFRTFRRYSVGKIWASPDSTGC